MSINIQNIQILREQTGAGLMDCKKALIEADNDISQAVRIIKATGVELAEKKAERIAADGIAYADVINGKAVLLELNTETDFVSNSPHFRKSVCSIAQTIAAYEPKNKDQLLQCTCEGENFSINSLLQKMIITFRENIQLRRFQVLSGKYPIAYMHSGGKYGVILQLDVNGENSKTDIKSIGKELAMQIASMAPDYLSQKDIPEAMMSKLQRETQLDIASDKKLNSKPDKVVEQIYQGRIKKFMKTHCLLEQPFIKDDTITVGQFLADQGNKHNIEITVTKYFRYEKAEGLQDSCNTDKNFSAGLENS